MPSRSRRVRGPKAAPIAGCTRPPSTTSARRGPPGESGCDGRSVGHHRQVTVRPEALRAMRRLVEPESISTVQPGSTRAAARATQRPLGVGRGWQSAATPGRSRARRAKRRHRTRRQRPAAARSRQVPANRVLRRVEFGREVGPRATAAVAQQAIEDGGVALVGKGRHRDFAPAASCTINRPNMQDHAAGSPPDDGQLPPAAGTPSRAARVRASPFPVPDSRCTGGR